MGRPSLAAERRPQVLSAFARCVARSGFDGTSLADVADEAGLSRGHVRHYLGNRHDQVVALARWASEQESEALSRRLRRAGGGDPLEAGLGYLFEPAFHRPGDVNKVYLALFEQAVRDDELRVLLLRGYDDLQTTLTRAIAAQWADAGPDDPPALAYLLMCAALGNAHMAQLGAPRRRTQRMRSTARDVVAALVGRVTTGPGAGGARVDEG